MWNAYVFGMFKVQGLNKKFNKIEKKSKIQNFAFLEFFVILFLHTFTKLHVASVIQAQVIMQNVILNKSHFCKKLQFLTSLPNFDQNLQKKLSSKIFLWFGPYLQGRNFRGKKMSQISLILAKFAKINSFFDPRKCRFAKINSREIFQN